MRKRKPKVSKYSKLKPLVKCDCRIDTLVNQGLNWQGLTIYWCKVHHTSRVQ